MAIVSAVPHYLPQAYALDRPVGIFIPAQEQGIPLANGFVFLDRRGTLGLGTKVTKGLPSRVKFRLGFESLRSLDDRARRLDGIALGEICP